MNLYFGLYLKRERMSDGSRAKYEYFMDRNILRARDSTLKEIVAFIALVAA